MPAVLFSFSAAYGAVLPLVAAPKLCGKPRVSSVNKRCVKRPLLPPVDKHPFHAQGVNRTYTVFTPAEHNVSFGCSPYLTGVSAFYPQIHAAYL